MKIKYNKKNNELTIDLDDTLEFDTNIHDFEDETVVAITLQKNHNSLVAQLKRRHPVHATEQARSLMEFLNEHDEDEDDS